MSLPPIQSVLASFDPTSDPSNRHYQEAVKAQEAAVAANRKVVQQFIELPRQLNSCYEKIAIENPHLIELLNMLKGSSIPNDTPQIDLEKRAKQLAILNQAINANPWALFEAELNKINKFNKEKEEELASEASALATTKESIEKAKANAEKARENLFIVVDGCVQMESKLLS